MTAAILSVLAATLAGWPAARALSGRTDLVTLVGRAFLLGAALIAILLLVLSGVPYGWSRSALAAGVVVLVLVTGSRRSRWPPIEPLRRASVIGLLAAAILVGPVVVGHGVFASVAPPADVDFLENWGWKGKSFFHHSGVDWTLLTQGSGSENRPDYPILLPLLFAFVGIMNGGWSDEHVGLLATAFAVALLLIVSGDLFRQSREWAAWLIPLILLILAPLALVPWIGLAEAPFIAFATAGLIAIRRGMLEGEASETRVGAILLGCAALTKNEGIVVILAATSAYVIAARPGRKSEVVSLWPAFALALVWFVPQKLAGLRVDLVDSGLAGRLADGLSNFGVLADAFVRNAPGRPWFWIGLAGVALIALPQLLRRERFVMITLLLQSAAYVGVYLITPYDAAWHVQWSLERVLRHLAVPLTYSVLLAGLSALVLHPASDGPESGRSAPS